MATCQEWLERVEDLGHDLHLLGQQYQHLRVSRISNSTASRALSADAYISFAAIAPTAIQGLGYSKANAQLLTIPVYVAAVVMILIIANLSDKMQVRWYFIFGSYCLAAFGLIVELAIPHDKRPGLVYGFLFPLLMGLYGIFPPLISWMGEFTSLCPYRTTY